MHQLLLVYLGRLKCSSSGIEDKTKMAALEKTLKEDCPGGLHKSVYLDLFCHKEIVFVEKKNFLGNITACIANGTTFWDSHVQFRNSIKNMKNFLVN